MPTIDTFSPSTVQRAAYAALGCLAAGDESVTLSSLAAEYGCERSGISKAVKHITGRSYGALRRRAGLRGATGPGPANGPCRAVVDAIGWGLAQMRAGANVTCADVARRAGVHPGTITRGVKRLTGKSWQRNRLDLGLGYSAQGKRQMNPAIQRALGAAMKLAAESPNPPHLQAIADEHGVARPSLSAAVRRATGGKGWSRHLIEMGKRPRGGKLAARGRVRLPRAAVAAAARWWYDENAAGRMHDLETAAQRHDLTWGPATEKAMENEIRRIARRGGQW